MSSRRKGSHADPARLGRASPTPDPPADTNRLRQLRSSTVAMVRCLLLDRGVSAADAELGLDYAEAQGARTALVCYVLAMSRVLFTDGQLAAGMRFDPNTSLPGQGEQGQVIAARRAAAR